MFARVVVLGALLTASEACVTSNTGVTRATQHSLVTIGAGIAVLGGVTGRPAWYLIDKRTQTCWMTLATNTVALAYLDCCALRRVSEAQPYITWTSCPGDVPSPPAITPGSPAPGVAAPASSPDAH